MDNGLLPEMPFTMVDTWFDTLSAVEDAAKSSAQTVVAESLQFFEQQVFNHTCNLHYNGNFTDKKGWLNFAEGNRTAATRYWPALLDNIDVVLKAGKHFIMTGHTLYSTTNNPHGENFDVERAFCSSQIWSATHPFIQCVCHIGLHVDVQTAETRAEKSKATDDYMELVMHTHSTYKGAKNKWGVQAPIRCGITARATHEELCKAARLDPETCFSNRRK